MYGLEKSDKKPFQFDLEMELKSNPGKAKELLKQVEEKIAEVKSMINKSSDKKEQNELGVILQGFSALETVLKRAAAKK